MRARRGEDESQSLTMPTPRTRNLSVSTMRTPGDTTASRTRSPDSDFVTARLHLPFQSRVMVSGSKRSEKNAVSTTSTRLYTYISTHYTSTPFHT